MKYFAVLTLLLCLACAWASEAEDVDKNEQEAEEKEKELTEYLEGEEDPDEKVSLNDTSQK